MSETTVETTVDLLSYLRQSNGVTPTTINTLEIYGFDSSASLMAIDVNKDLPKMTAINMGQRALLRRLIRNYMIIESSDSNHMSDSEDEEMVCDENRCQNNQNTINKMREILQTNSNKKINKLSASLKNCKLVLVRTKYEVIKLKNENMAKDNEIKRLKSEAFRLRNRNNSEKNFKKLENSLKEKDLYIKRLEEKVSKLKRKIDENTKEFKEYNKKCFNDLKKLKKFLVNESQAFHRQQLSYVEEPVLTQVNSGPSRLQALPKANTVEDKQNSEPNISELDTEPLEPISQVINEEIDKQLLEEEVFRSANNTDDNCLSFDDTSMMSMTESQDMSDSTCNTSSQVVRVSKEISFQYLSPIESNKSLEISSQFVDHNYTLGEPSLPSKMPVKCRSKRLAEKTRSNSISENISKDQNKRLLNRRTSVGKKMRTEEETTDALKEDNQSTNLVFSTELKKTVLQEEEQRVRRDSVTLSSITGSKLISIDISGESDGYTTDNTSLTLRQNVISNDKVSQIATSNGYLSDSNEENHCSVVNSVAPIASTLMRTRRSSADTSLQQKRKGFKCTLPDCDFITLFKTKYDDHISNHVTYHFGQEIPDYFRPYFEEFKKSLPQFKNN